MEQHDDTGEIYSYLIGWSKHNKWYYGVRYGRSSKIGDIWQVYFTSSKVVMLMREMCGEPDVVQVRKVFKTATEALEWERKLLTRIGADKSPFWLNMTCGGGGINHPPSHKNKVWINNGSKNKRVVTNHLNTYTRNGWQVGRLLTGAVKFYEHGNRKRCPTTGRFLPKL